MQEIVDAAAQAGVPMAPDDAPALDGRSGALALARSEGEMEVLQGTWHIIRTMSRDFRTSLAAIVLMVTGCVSVAPQAEKIRVTSNGADVAQCKVLGVVESHPPYMFPSDGVNQLRNNAAALDADTLLLTSSGALRGKTGMAYRCAK